LTNSSLAAPLAARAPAQPLPALTRSRSEGRALSMAAGALSMAGDRGAPGRASFDYAPSLARVTTSKSDYGTVTS
jgi:hypothetical protein